MSRQRIYLNAFPMNCVVYHWAGLWPYLQDKMHKYTDIETWIEPSQLLEQARFDALLLATYIGIGGAGPVLVGSYQQIADQLQLWLDAGIDGFNLVYRNTLGCFVDFIEGVVPIVPARDLMQRGYLPGALREKPGNSGAYLPDSHSGARLRRREPA